MMRYAPLADTRLGAAVFGFPPYAAKPMRRERVSRRGPSRAGERAARALTQERPEHNRALPFKAENRSGQTQARGAALELRPPARPPRPWEAFHGPRAAAHSPAVKDQSNHTPLRPGRGLGVPNPQGMRQPTPARPGASVPCLHAQCLRPTSTDGQDLTPPLWLFDTCRGWATM